MEYLLERDPETGIYETFEYDDATGNITIRRWVDVQPAIDANKSAHLDGDGKHGDMWHAASVPVHLADKLKLERGIDFMRADHWPEVKKLLQDPDWRYLRPTSFRL
jgi:hypothetical protein